MAGPNSEALKSAKLLIMTRTIESTEDNAASVLSSSLRLVLRRDDATGHWRLLNLSFKHCSISKSGECSTDDRGGPEQPELLQRPAADEERWTCAARRVHRRVR